MESVVVDPEFLVLLQPTNGVFAWSMRFVFVGLFLLIVWRWDWLAAKTWPRAVARVASLGLLGFLTAFNVLVYFNTKNQWFTTWSQML